MNYKMARCFRPRMTKGGSGGQNTPPKPHSGKCQKEGLKEERPGEERVRAKKLILPGESSIRERFQVREILPRRKGARQER